MPNEENEQQTPIEKLKQTLKKVEINGKSFYVAEGDLLVEEGNLEKYAAERAHNMKPQPATGDGTDALSRLIAIKDPISGKAIRWKPGTVLSYCVLKRTFADTAKYNTVKINTKLAAFEWQAVCGIEFEYREQFDDTDDGASPDVLFTVQEVDVGGRFIAASFFPNDPPIRRVLVIDPTYYTTSFDKVGVLRHELGHVLGFRHEQISSLAPPVCQGELVGEVIELTKYDPKSVMHYFCGGVGSKKLEITDVDKEGAVKLYGPSFDDMSFFS